MDFIVLSALIGAFMLALTLSYDICCQWSRNLAKRMPQFPPFMRISPNQLRGTKFVLPKFHIFNHGIKCIINYSLNFLRWSAASDLEDPERWWAHINPISMSTKEMSEGSRHDTIDDHACSWNWRKITGFSMLSELRDCYIVLITSQSSYSRLALRKLWSCRPNMARTSSNSIPPFRPLLLVSGRRWFRHGTRTKQRKTHMRNLSLVCSGLLVSIIVAYLQCRHHNDRSTAGACNRREC